MNLLISFAIMAWSILVGILSLVAIMNEIITKGKYIKSWIILESIAIIAFVYSIYDAITNIISILIYSSN